jgi:hypothetical protein
VQSKPNAQQQKTQQPKQQNPSPTAPSPSPKTHSNISGNTNNSNSNSTHLQNTSANGKLNSCNDNGPHILPSIMSFSSITANAFVACLREFYTSGVDLQEDAQEYLNFLLSKLDAELKRMLTFSLFVFWFVFAFGCFLFVVIWLFVFCATLFDVLRFVASVTFPNPSSISHDREGEGDQWITKGKKKNVLNLTV